MQIVSYELGGVKTPNIGGISYNQKNTPRSSAPRQNNLDTHHTSTVRKQVRANGTSIRPMLYWGFFTVMSLTVISTLINNTEFGVIEQKIMGTDDRNVENYEARNPEKLLNTFEQLIIKYTDTEATAQFSEAEQM